MFFTYKPADGDEQRWTFKPNKMPNHEAEAIEKRTDWTYGTFCIKLQQGSTLARRALLWVFLRRQHPTIRFEDVRFETGELELEMDAGELAAMRQQVESSNAFDDETKAAALEQMDEQLKTAEPDPDAVPKEPKD